MPVSKTDNGTLPNLVCVGVEKAGTTLLYDILYDHPDVFVPPRKELFFFSRRWDEGIDWYREFFQGKADHKWCMDITPSYFRADKTLKRIHDTLDDVTILILIRNPVRRAISHYVHGLAHGEVQEDFHTYYEQGHYYFTKYAPRINRLYEIFGRENVIVAIYEDIFQDPDNWLKNKISDLLQIRSLPTPDLNSNPTYFPFYLYSGERELLLEDNEERYRIPPRTMIFSAGEFGSIHRPYSLDRVWDNPDSALVADALFKQQRWTRHFSSRTCRKILDEYFLDDAREVERLTGHDVVDTWKQDCRAITYDFAPPAPRFLVNAG